MKTFEELIKDIKDRKSTAPDFMIGMDNTIKEFNDNVKFFSDRMSKGHCINCGDPIKSEEDDMCQVCAF